MTYAFNYARKKLENVVFILATGEGDVRSRLRRSHREIKMLGEYNMPQDLIQDLEWVQKSKVKYGSSADQNALDHTMGRIQNRTGKRIAEKIYSINSRLQTK